MTTVTFARRSFLRGSWCGEIACDDEANRMSQLLILPAVATFSFSARATTSSSVAPCNGDSHRTQVEWFCAAPGLTSDDLSSPCQQSNGTVISISADAGESGVESLPFSRPLFSSYLAASANS